MVQSILSHERGLFMAKNQEDKDKSMTFSLLDIIRREVPPIPWAEGEKIPWNEPDFSAHMLKEHLSQAYDAASRRTPIIQQHVDWIHETVLSGKPSRLLDLGCGPGLYCRGLAEKEHTCTGIDFSPASIAYARQHALDSCHYIEGDIRSTEFGTGYNLVMLIFGEFNTFRKSDAGSILRKAHAALSPDGILLLEPHLFEFVRKLGQEAPRWSSYETGLFSAQPHLLLMDNYWHEAEAITTERYYVVDAASGHVTRHASSIQAYTHAAYQDLLADCGFRDIQFFDTFGTAPTKKELIVITAQK
jgi:SAM-dependent methyltransferase